jgi:Flp pilus assembly protein TadG
MKRKRRSGQAVLELALVLPIFLFVLLGIIDFGRAMHCWSNLNHQCVQAARVATKRTFLLVAPDIYGSSTHTPLTDVQSAFWQARSPLMPEADYQGVTFTGAGTTDRVVEVSARFTMSLYTPIFGRIIGGTSPSGSSGLTISAVAREHKE